MATPLEIPIPPTSIWANFPGEILNEIYSSILAGDHTRNDVLALLKVNKHFNSTLKKRIVPRLNITLDHGVPEVLPSNGNTSLPSMVRTLLLCRHGPCAHTQQDLGLTSPNFHIKDLCITGGPTVINRDCGESSSCTPFKILRPTNLLLLNPREGMGGTVHDSVAEEFVQHLVYVLTPPAFNTAYLRQTALALPWYHYKYPTANKATLVFAPPRESVVADNDVLELQLLHILAVQIFRILESFQRMMMTDAFLRLRLTVVNVGRLHIRIISHCANGRLVTSIQDRQDAVQRWLSDRIEEWPDEYQVRGAGIRNRMRFLTLEEWASER